MRVQFQSSTSFVGTHKGSTIDIERESDGRFHIRVFNESGYGYDGWAPDTVTTMQEAKREAIRGAQL